MTIRHTALASVQSIILVTILVTGTMGFGISTPEAFAASAQGCENAKESSDGKTNNPHCEETGSGDGGDTGSGDSGQSSGSCDTDSDGVITAAELLAFTGTSIDWQAVIDSIEASLSGTDTNNNGLIDTSAEFAELQRVAGC